MRTEKSQQYDLGRLIRRSDFLDMNRDAPRWVSGTMIMQAETKDTLEGRSFGLTVSKKIGNAVQRNRIRRRLKAAAGDILGTMAKPKTRFVFIARKAAVEAPYDKLLADMKWCLKRLELKEETAQEGKA